ncbi:MAG: succinate dehydrogenase iron-sulfur subunit [Candidatus Zixiibacteriota bacterium]
MPKFKVFRFDRDKDEMPYFQTYDMPVVRGMTVLEGLYHIIENIDPSLAFRSSCRAAVCGSCAMHINGQYRLACETNIDHLKSDLITIRPMAHSPVMRDLVVDMKPFFRNYEKIMPYLIPKEEPPEKEYIQTVEERHRLDVKVDCILCGACFASCPVVSTDENYLGPAALLKALRFVDDTRDGATYERLAFLATDFGVFRCHTIFNCQQVCPKDLDPTGAIQRLKWKAIWAKLKGKLPKPQSPAA